MLCKLLVVATLADIHNDHKSKIFAYMKIEKFIVYQANCITRYVASTIGTPL